MITQGRSTDRLVAETCLGWSNVIELTNQTGTTTDWIGSPSGALLEYLAGTRNTAFDPLPHFSSYKMDAVAVANYIRQKYDCILDVVEEKNVKILLIKDKKTIHQAEANTVPLALCKLALMLSGMAI